MRSRDVSPSLMCLEELLLCNNLRLSVQQGKNSYIKRKEKALAWNALEQEDQQGASTNTHSAGHTLLPLTAPPSLLRPVSLAQGRGLSFCFWNQYLVFKQEKKKKRKRAWSIDSSM